MTGHDDEKRKVIHATVCAPAKDSLRDFCVGHGVSITAFLDGLGHALEGVGHTSLEQLKECAPTLAVALVQAREIVADRLSREQIIRPSSGAAPATEGDRSVR